MTVTLTGQPLRDGPEWRYEMHFAVRDTGISIPPAKAERLFRPFSQGDAARPRRNATSRPILSRGTEAWGHPPAPQPRAARHLNDSGGGAVRPGHPGHAVARDGWAHAGPGDPHAAPVRAADHVDLPGASRGRRARRPVCGVIEQADQGLAGTRGGLTVLARRAAFTGSEPIEDAPR